MRIPASALTFRVLLPPRLFIEALEIAGAVALGRYCGARVSTALRAYPTHRTSVASTLKIVRFIIAYLAILTIVWTLEFSSLSFIHQIALIVLAAFVAGGVLDGRNPVVRAMCTRCGAAMTPLAETSSVIVFGCQTCGTTLSASK